MPEQFALYPTLSKLALERVKPKEWTSDCTQCSLHRTTKQVLKGEMFLGAAAGENPPTLLVVGGNPGREENAENRVFVGRVGARVRPLLRSLWQGTIVLDSGVRCYPGFGPLRQEIEEKHVDACRPYLASTVEEAKPDRIVCLGAQALMSVLGRSISPLNSRRGYTWMTQGDRMVPVFYVLDPAQCLRNRFLMQFFEEDLRWALTAKLAPPRHFNGVVASLVMTPQDAAEACEDLQRGEGFAFDLEWAGFLWDPEFRLLSLAAAPVGRDTVWVWDEAALNDPARWGPLETLLLDEDAPKGGSNVKADQHALRCGKKIRVKGIAFDTRLERKLLEPEATANLEDMAELVGMGGHKEEAETRLTKIEEQIRAWAAEKRETRLNKQSGFSFAKALDAELFKGFDPEKYEHEPRAIAYAFLPKEIRDRYVARDGVTTARLESRFSFDLLKHKPQRRMWERVVLPAALAIQRVEEWGVPFDVGAGQLFHQMMRQNMDAAYTKVQQYAESGKELNPGSPQQLAKVLYDRLKLRVPGVTNTGAPSTDEEALTTLRDISGHPLPGYILEYRHYQKLVGYAEDWQRCVRADGRIHPSIHLDGARSGRTSCSNPNLQNIPRAKGNPDGKAARDCFAAPPGFVFVQLDYSQLELRIAALLARDVVMADLFRSGMDFHLATAKLICELAWGVTVDQVNDVHRTGAKAFNFGIAYGKTDSSLAEELGITVERAAQIRAAIFGKFVKYGQWCREAIGYARLHGGSWTVWEGEPARWRPLWRIGDDTDEGKQAASRAKNGAINTPIQGTASDFCIASITKLVDLHDRGELDAEVVLPIHDSIMLLCPEKTWKDSALAAKSAMESYPWCTDFVPLVVDVEMGKKWGSLEKVKLN